MRPACPSHTGGYRGVVACLVAVAVIGVAAALPAGAKPAGLGSKDAARGTAITVGYSTDGASETIDNTAEVAAAEVATKYVNAYLGGIGASGHKLELDVCDNHGTPSGAIDCVNQWVANDVPAVLVSSTAQGGPIADGLAEAGIPVLYYGSLNPTALSAANSNVLTNVFNTVFGAPAQFAKKKKFERAAFVTINLPAATGPAKTIGAETYEAAGVTLEIVPVAPGTPDMTAEIVALLETGPQLVNVSGNEPFCVAALRALQQQHFDGPIFILETCLGENTAAALPDGLAGIKIATSTSTDPTDKEVLLYRAAMKKYAPGADPSLAIAAGAWAATVAFARAMTALEGDVTATSVTEEFLAMAPQPMPLAAGVTFQCNREQDPRSPAVCSNGGVVITLDAEGNGVKFEPVGGKGK